MSERFAVSGRPRPITRLRRAIAFTWAHATCATCSSTSTGSTNFKVETDLRSVQLNRYDQGRYVANEYGVSHKVTSTTGRSLSLAYSKIIFARFSVVGVTPRGSTFSPAPCSVFTNGS